MTEPQEPTIVDKVSRYFYESDDFARGLEQFAEANAHRIDLDEIETSGLMRVEYTDVHGNYRALFEGKIESFIAGCGSTVEEFYDELRRKSRSDPDCGEAVLGRLMLAAADFDVFVLMMTEAAGKKVRAADDEPGSAAEAAPAS